MGKISQESSKYIIHANITVGGTVDRPDVIGAIFGQTEGLLGSDLELRELQRSGRIGRIEVNLETKNGKSNGEIILPSSLDKAETSIIGAAMEIIQRIGPCNAKIKVTNIEDVRTSKRHYVMERAKELLKTMIEDMIPESQEITDQVASSVRMMEVQEYGKDKLTAGSGIWDTDDVIIVEGRADVLNLLRHGFKNCIALNGTSVPDDIIDICNKKIVTIFADGDRGGDLIIKELSERAEVDFVTKAPDGKEVEELTKKEIHHALRGKVAPEQMKVEEPIQAESQPKQKQQKTQQQSQQKTQSKSQQSSSQSKSSGSKPSDKDRKVFRELLEDLIGTRGAYILNQDLSILGKVPSSELETSLKNLSGSGVYAVVFDGDIDRNLGNVASKIKVKFLVAMKSKIRQNDVSVKIITKEEL